MPDSINSQVKSIMFNVPYEGIETDIKFVGKIVARINKSKLKNHGKLMVINDHSTGTKSKQEPPLPTAPYISGDELNIWSLEPGKSTSETDNSSLYDDITEAEIEERRRLIDIEEPLKNETPEKDEFLGQKYQFKQQLVDDQQVQEATVTVLNDVIKNYDLEKLINPLIMIENVHIDWPLVAIDRMSLTYLKMLSKTLPQDTWSFVKCYILYILEQNEDCKNNLSKGVHYQSLIEHICKNLIPASVPEKLGYLLNLYHKSKFTPSTSLMLEIITVISNLWSQQSQHDIQKLENVRKEYSNKLLETCSSVTVFLTTKYLKTFGNKEEVMIDQQCNNSDNPNIKKQIVNDQNSESSLINKKFGSSQQLNDTETVSQIQSSVSNKMSPQQKYDGLINCLVHKIKDSTKKDIISSRKPRTSIEETEFQDKHKTFRTKSDSCILHRASSAEEVTESSSSLENNVISFPQSSITTQLANRLDTFSCLLQSYKNIDFAFNTYHKKRKSKPKQNDRPQADLISPVSSATPNILEAECFNKVDSYNCFYERKSSHENLSEPQQPPKLKSPVFTEISNILNNENILFLKHLTKQVEKVEINTSKVSYRKYKNGQIGCKTRTSQVVVDTAYTKKSQCQMDNEMKIISANDDSMYSSGLQSSPKPNYFRASREHSSQKEACSLFVSMLPENDICSKSYFEIKLAPSTPSTVNGIDTPSRITEMTNTQNSVIVDYHNMPRFQNKRQRLRSKMLASQRFPTLRNQRNSNISKCHETNARKYSQIIQKKLNIVSETLLKLYHFINSECDMETDNE